MIEPVVGRANPEKAAVNLGPSEAVELDVRVLGLTLTPACGPSQTHDFANLVNPVTMRQLPGELNALGMLQQPFT